MKDFNEPSHLAGAEPAGEWAAVVAIDWGGKRHAWALAKSPGQKPETGWLESQPEAIEQWARRLAASYPGAIAVVVELRRGPLVAQLSKFKHLVIHPVHPSTLAQYRLAFRPSGAKNDPSDASALLDLFFRHPDKCPPLAAEPVETRTLQFLVEDRRKLVGERVRCAQRLQDALKHYLPQILDWFPDPGAALVEELLARWPGMAELKLARSGALRTFFRKHKYSQERIEQRLNDIRAAVPATYDEAVLRASQLLVKQLLALHAQLRASIAEYDAGIRKLARSHPDFAVVNSFPGAGEALAPRLLVLLGTNRDRYKSAAELQSYTGIAPVLEESGQRSWARFRHVCPRFLRQTVHEWAQHSIPLCRWAGEYYRQQRARGKPAQTAIRALGYKWLRILFRCWQAQTPYNDEYYEQRLLRTRSTYAHAEPQTVEIKWKSVAGLHKPAVDFS